MPKKPHSPPPYEKTVRGSKIYARSFKVNGKYDRFQFGPANCTRPVAVAHYEAWIEKVRAYAAADGVGPRPRTTEMPVDDAAAAARQAMDPRSENTVGDMVDQFMEWAEAQALKPKSQKGVSPAMVANWKNDGCKRIVAYFGRAKKLTDIGTVDFDAFRYSDPITKKRDGSPASDVTVVNRIERCLKVFDWAGNVKRDDRLRTIPFGTGLEFVPAREESSEDRPVWEVDVYARQLEVADVKWTAILLFALNCGFQNVDI